MLAAIVQLLLIVQQDLHFKLPCVSLVLYSTMRKHSCSQMLASVGKKQLVILSYCDMNIYTVSYQKSVCLLVLPLSAWRVSKYCQGKPEANLALVLVTLLDLHENQCSK